jgi:hypothetical protein
MSSLRADGRFEVADPPIELLQADRFGCLRVPQRWEGSRRGKDYLVGAEPIGKVLLQFLRRGENLRPALVLTPKAKCGGISSGPCVPMQDFGPCCIRRTKFSRRRSSLVSMRKRMCGSILSLSETAKRTVLKVAAFVFETNASWSIAKHDFVSGEQSKWN